MLLPPSTPDRCNVQHRLIFRNAQNLIHFVVKESRNAADAQSQPNRGQIQPLAQMPRIQMQVSVGPIAPLLNSCRQISRMKDYGHRITAQLLT